MAETGMTLSELLVYVERALGGDGRLRMQLFGQLQQLALHPTAPDHERALGEALCQVLLGSRSPDLSGLDPEAAREVRAWLEELVNSDQ